MRIRYDKKIDALYIKLRSGRYDHTKKITGDILVDVTKAGEVLGLEILEASKNIGRVKKEKVPIEFTAASP